MPAVLSIFDSGRFSTEKLGWRRVEPYATYVSYEYPRGSEFPKNLDFVQRHLI
eukprot:SAG25_NODE_5977_length_599_cov_7.666000_1_plen_52_part_10